MTRSEMTEHLFLVRI